MASPGLVWKKKILLVGALGATHNAMLNEDRNRRRHNTGLPYPRGRPSKLSETKVDWMDKILQTWGLEARAFTWTQLGTAAEVPEVGWRTIQRAITKRGYNKCIACTKTYASKPLKAKRRDWAWEKKNTWTLDDWKKMRFSDEVHFGRGPQRKLQIIRKPGKRTCEDCIQEQDEPEKKTEAVSLLGSSGMELQVRAGVLRGSWQHDWKNESMRIY